MLTAYRRLPSANLGGPHTVGGIQRKGGNHMYGTFGGYTRWAVVFLIIFVLLFLIVPGITSVNTTTTSR